MLAGIRTEYSNTPEGLPGNEDCGQMSAWYLFSIMGFYPVTPGSNLFAVGAPQFPRFEIDRGGDAGTLSIIADNLSDKNIYVKSVTVDGRRLTDSHLTWNDISKAREIRFAMTDQPSTFWK